MVDFDDSSFAQFQHQHSTTIDVVRFLITQLANTITFLRDAMFMIPEASSEKKASREVYRDFYRSFSDLFLLTRDVVHDANLKQAIEVWLNTPYRTETKQLHFTDGLSFAEDLLHECHLLGLLDLQINQPVRFPFEFMLRQARIRAEQEAQKQQLLQATKDLQPNQPRDDGRHVVDVMKYLNEIPDEEIDVNDDSWNDDSKAWREE